MISALPNHNAYRSFLVLLAISVISIGVYHEIFTHQFIDYDDTKIITKRIDKYDGLTFDNITDIILYDYPREEPLIIRDISYLINAELFGPLNPFGYLLGNLALHIVCAFLFYKLFLYIFPENHFTPILAAIIFAIHPVNVESVAWISSRKNSLYAIFLLFGLLSYMRFFATKKNYHLVVSAVFFPFALLSKAAAISFLPILLCYRFIMQKEYKWGWQEIYFVASILLISIVFIEWYSSILQEYGVIKPLTLDRDWLAWVLSTCEFITFYTTQLIAPLQLSTFYDFPAPHLIYSNVPYLVTSLSLAVTSIVICWLLYKRGGEKAFFLIAFFISTIIPYLNFADVKIYVADRYLYLASGAFAVAVAYTSKQLQGVSINCLGSRSLKAPIAICTLLYCTFLGAQSVKATRTWESTYSFWENAKQAAPNRIEPYYGQMLQFLHFAELFPRDPYAEKSIENAKNIGNTAIDKFCPSSTKCDNKIYLITTLLGRAFWLDNKPALSEYYFNKTFEINPNYYNARYTYAIILTEQANYNEALDQIAFIEKNANPDLDANILLGIKETLKPLIANRASK